MTSNGVVVGTIGEALQRELRLDEDEVMEFMREAVIKAVAKEFGARHSRVVGEAIAQALGCNNT
jgi:hypothetical protein